MAINKTSHLHKEVYSIIIILSGLGRIKRNVPPYSETRLEVEAAGCGDGDVGLVKIDGASVVGKALLKIEPCVETNRAAVVQKRVAQKLLGIEACAEAVIAFFVIELDLRYYVVVGFYAQAVQHIAAAKLHENTAILVVLG